MPTPMGRLLGHYVETEAEGAIPNRTRIRKTAFEEGDGNPIGSLGTVVGSVVSPLDDGSSGYAYFIEWDRFPGLAVFCVGWKIGRAS